MKLLTSQKNTLFDILLQYGFNPSSFTYKEESNGISIILNNSEFYFSFKEAPNSALASHRIKYCPAGDQYDYSKAIFFEFPKVTYTFTDWCISLKAEAFIDDKWARLEQEMKSASISFESENDKFSFAEYQEVKIKVEVLKEQIKAIPLEPAQLEAIENKLDHLITQAETLSKFDWKSMFVGTIMNIVITLSVTPTNASALWILIKQVFSGYFLS